MNGKKLLIIISFVFGYSGFSYGMDGLRRSIAGQEWAMIVFDIRDAKAAELPQFIGALLDATIDFNAANDHGQYLIDRWLVWYADDELSDQQRLNLRTCLKELIKHNKIDSDLKGRDFNCDEKEKQFALAMLQQTCQEIAAERTPRLNKKYMWGGLIAVCVIAAGCMLYRWHTQKVEKGDQEENNLDEHNEDSKQENQETLTVQ